VTALPGLRLGTLTYVVSGERVLLIHRAREPHRGLWVAPGGKLEPGESPHEGAVREIREETGLQIESPQLRGVITEVSTRPDYQWLLFLFRAERFTGDVRASDEGELVWHPLDQMSSLPMPDSDAAWWSHVVSPDGGVFVAKFNYDAALRVTSWMRY
jgi:ADP-ribose pyrophosphatase YjhB (NUDIX family)